MYYSIPGEEVYIGNIRFLIIITLILIPAIVIFILNCKTKSGYQKMLDEQKKGGEKIK